MSIDQSVMRGNFDMGRVAKETFASLRKHAAILFPAALILIPGAQLLGFFAAKTGMDPTDPAKIFSSPLYWVSLVVSIVAGYLLQAIIIHTVVEGHRGNQVSLGSAFGASIGRIFPLFILAIISSLGVGLGMILLFVPGIILGIMWSVASPALVVEGIGPLAALGRSRALTKGSRWPIFGLIMIAGILYIILAGAVQGFNFAAAQAGNLDAFSAPQIIASVIIGTVGSVVFACGAAAIYSELRLIKEGVGNSELAAVFE